MFSKPIEYTDINMTENFKIFDLRMNQDDLIYFQAYNNSKDLSFLKRLLIYCLSERKILKPLFYVGVPIYEYKGKLYTNLL